MKHKIIKKTLLTIGISLSIVNSHLSIAQRSLGVSGLLNIPSADMQEDGTFMAGGNYLPQEMLPQEWGYNSGNYFVNLTFLPFMEVAYRCTLLKVESTGKWNQDRSVSLRLRPLKEGKWWPSVVIGSNDLLTTGELNPFLDSGGNRYFSSVYAVGTKHFGFYGHDIGVTVGGHVPFRSRSENKGVFGGVSYRPAFLKPLEVMAEYDSKAVNMGVSARLFDHFSLYAYCYDFKTVAGGIRYELTPRQRVFNPDEVRMPWDGRVELVLNGHTVGSKTLKNDCLARFSIPYESGTLEAVSYDAADHEMGRCKLQSAGGTTRLTLDAEEPTVKPGHLCYVRLRYTDENGITKPLARGNIQVQVRGGTLVGLGSACPFNKHSYLDSETDTYYGEALAIVRMGDGDAMTIAASDGEYSAELTVPAQA